MSEKTEVKNIEWLKEEVWKQDIVMDKGYIYTDDLMSIINEVVEPEVLSQEFIGEHAEHHEYIGYAGVPVDDLQNLLVPKQEEVDQAYKDGYEKGKEHATKVIKPTIPRFVAEHIENRRGESLAQAYNIPTLTKVGKWLLDKKNCETFARAWLDGYTVEEEQKYLVIILDDGIGAYLIYYPKSGNYGITGILDDSKGITRFTEQEIKDYDKRFWAFAIKVEEFEE